MGVSRINRKSFMAEMRSLLAFMDADERARVLRFYERLFDEAGEEGEMALLKKLGSPVRQVLQVERKYREKLEAEEEDFAAEPVMEPVPAEAEPAPEGPAAPAEPLPEEAGEEPAEEPADVPYAGVISAETFAGETLEETLPETEDEVTESVAPPDTYEEQSAEAQEEAAGEPTEEAPPADDAPVGAGRVVAAVFVTIPMIVFVVLGIAVSLVLGMIGLGPGVFLGAAGGYLAGYAFGGVTVFLPDILLLAGGALLCFCLALFLLWLGIWLAVGGTRLTVRITAAVYRGILKRGGRAHE